MCVDKENNKCCWGCDFTVSTTIYGVVNIISGIGSLATNAGFNFFGVFQFVMGILMCCVICRKKDVGLRKGIYYAYVAYCIILLIWLLAVIVLIFAIDWSTVYISSEWEKSFSDAVHAGLIVLVIIWAFIYIPITLAGLEICYYGWKE